MFSHPKTKKFEYPLSDEKRVHYFYLWRLLGLS
jgi:hypothetical protein